eukprot:jgi/Botrbrau1/1754/Bobra.0217s0012.2
MSSDKVSCAMLSVHMMPTKSFRIHTAFVPDWCGAVRNPRAQSPRLRQRQWISGTFSTPDRTTFAFDHREELKINGSPKGMRVAASWITRAKKNPQDDVELDDEGSLPALPPAVKQAWTTAMGLVDRLVDIINDLVPSSISRPVVDTSVRAALILLVLGIAQGVLGVIFTLGSLALVLYIGTRLWSKGNASGGGPKEGGR